MWWEPRHQIVLVMTLLLLMGLAVPAAAAMPKVEGEATFTDYPDDYAAGILWDVWAVKVSAHEPDKGTLQMWNPFKDWDYVENLDPAVVGLPEDTDMKEIAKWLKDLIKEIWMKVDITCVNIVDNRAIVGGQITKAGDVYVEGGLLNTWIGIEFFDMSGDPDVDDYREAIWSNPFPDDPEEEPFFVTEEMVTEWCAAGDVPVPPDWFYYQTEWLSGDIEIKG